MMPGEIGVTVATLEKMRIELEKRPLKINRACSRRHPGADALNIYLGWDDDQQAKEKRNKQPLEAFADILPARPEMESKIGACPRQKEQQRHMPLVDEHDQPL